MPSPATAKRLFEEGKVREAQGELSAYLRERPADTAQRTFLFELLCFPEILIARKSSLAS